MLAYSGELKEITGTGKSRKGKQKSQPEIWKAYERIKEQSIVLNMGYPEDTNNL